ncbi:MAG: hypothetical protein VXW36_05945, partial [Candidatus Thermoplasmatota archaeon]|nr:hypothetical protein [Candidatus Thermoplasmatota archaeon]
MTTSFREPIDQQYPRLSKWFQHRVFRETKDVVFYDISVEESNASDLVVHEGPAVSPPDDSVGAKQFYVHY